MAISLNTNIASLSAARRLNKTTESLSAVTDRLSSGLRITKPSDDPVGAQIADTLAADAKIAATAVQNANTAISYTSIADSSLSNVSGLLQRLAELAEQSANGVYANSQRSALSNEFVALGSEIQRIAVTTSFNGINLLSGGSAVTLQVGIDGSANSRITLNAINGTLADLGLAASGSSALSYSIIDTTASNSETASRNALDGIKAALTSLNNTRGNLGATGSRLNTAIQYLQGARQEFVAAEGRIRDADIAQDVAELVRLQVLQQANTSVLAQANQQPGVALRLLQ